MTDRELLQMALDALEHGLPIIEDFGGKEQLQIQHKAISALYEALRAALAQPEQEEDYDAIANKQLASLKAAAKVTFEDAVVRAVHKLYNAPPQREWQGLTDKEIENCFEMSMFGTCRAIEAKLKEKNG